MATLMEKEAALYLIGAEIGRILNLTDNPKDFRNTGEYKELLDMQSSLLITDYREFDFQVFHKRIKEIEAIFDDIENTRKNFSNNNGIV